eukprot:3284047-Ditylum_brightwellii.AAC.1
MKSSDCNSLYKKGQKSELQWNRSSTQLETPMLRWKGLVVYIRSKIWVGLAVFLPSKIPTQDGIQS